MTSESHQPTQGIARYPVLIYVRGTAVVFGGGEVGMRKASSLARRGISVRVIDRRGVHCPEGVCLIQADVDGETFERFIDAATSLVVCALDDPDLNDAIARHCMQRCLPVNVATSSSGGTFAFPAIIDCGQELIAVSSKDASPQCTYALKRYVERELPNIETFSLLVHTLSEEGALDRHVIGSILDDAATMELIRSGRYEDALKRVREVIL
jgi:siroheme synthase-like protein